MSFIIQAPYPAIQDGLVLPSPKYGNSRKPTSKVQLLHTMNGGTKSYITRCPDSDLKFDFILNTTKIDELKNFFIVHNASRLLLTLPNLDLWSVFLITNPISLTWQNRAFGNAHPILGPNEVEVLYKEAISLTLDFRGIKVDG